MIRVGVVLCLFFGYCNCIRNILEEPHIEFNETECVDDILYNVKQKIAFLHLNNILLPDVYLQVNTSSIALTNGSIRNIANIQRVGDVMVDVGLFDTTFSSAFAIYNVSIDQDVAIHSLKYNASHGHIHGDCDNVTIFTVFEFTYATQTLSLEQFQLSIGYIDFNITGMGQRLANDSALTTKIINKVKGPALAVFNITFKFLFNMALAAVRAAMTG